MSFENGFVIENGILLKYDGTDTVVEIPENEEVAALIPLGYPDIDPEAPPRKDASKLLTFK